MKRAYLRAHGKSGFELIEEAFVVLRTCPPRILAAYFLGSAPFVAGFLIFCSYLSRSAGAAENIGGATLAMAALFIAMKCLHARFGRLLLAHLRGEPAPSRPLGETIRSFCSQTTIHATALIVLPVSMILVLPFGWAYAFYQNVTALDDGRLRTSPLIRLSAHQSALWAVQNHVLLLVLSGFGLFVFLDWITILYSLPQLLMMLFGIESVFTRSPWSVFNTTFFAVTFALTYLSVDPLIKTCYVLRCFYGASLQSGDDLKTEVLRLSRVRSALAACLLLFATPPSLHAEEATTPPTHGVDSPVLNDSISTVIQQEKYTWRMPRENSPKKTDGLTNGFLKTIFDFAKNTLKSIWDLLEKMIDWIRDRDRSSRNASTNTGWETPQISLLFVILGIVACGLALAALRLLKERRRAHEVQASVIAHVPDPGDENTLAADLPEDDWIRMGRRYLEGGEPRLALRAFYLATLSHLAARGLVTITRSKSNRDYEREIRRRSHALPQLDRLFVENVGIFDRTWYGWHEASPELVLHFISNLEEIKKVS